ncbi:tetratricopeptide repeat protein [Roseinatronobacter alkalisoli]|uniref:Tetratricopeptide repeat protein n=1 Tax=Roseinatronobacter alkalisoli TaxID=3028235 RepID=A0ABT5T9G2_9RHOB|nr:tetratricopeptide repeat protein [Roseinatronobacter sp. HJB301]MDD7971753.1 tetratricopeptide repeat protein [Roseinatronobacter sp. HJB301]
MRHPGLIALLAGSVFVVAACEGSKQAAVTRAIDSVVAVDNQNMADLMLAAGNPEEAVSYFAAQVERDPTHLGSQRGLARSLVRAGRVADALPVWQRVTADADATHDDRLMLADTYIRANRWAEAERTLNAVPPTHESYDRYRLEAIIADSKQQWQKADHFYETAAGLTTRPAGVLNNWGYSKLTRGAPRDAESLFAQALQHDPDMFTAKNNMALARAAQGNYSLPLVRMSQQERAMLLHTMAIAAIRKGDTNVGRTMLSEAIETHPQHFEEAVRALRALEGGGRG